MKKLFFVLSIALALPVACLAPAGCKSPPSARVIEVQTLKAVGESAEASVAIAAHLYGDHKITAVQALQVMDTYDKEFQPAFRIASAAVQGNLATVAPADVLALGAKITQLVTNLQTSK